MSEYQRRSRFGSETFEVDAVPGGDGGGEDARFRSKRGRGIVADAETIAVVRTPCVL